MTELEKAVDRILALYANYLQDGGGLDRFRADEDEAKYAILALIQDEVRKARIDFLSDMIIECYNHDDSMDIAKELEEERRQLEAQLSEGKG